MTVRIVEVFRRTLLGKKRSRAEGLNSEVWYRSLSTSVEWLGGREENTLEDHQAKGKEPNAMNVLA